MQVFTLGKIIPTFKGKFKKGDTYSDLDVVCYNGSSFVCISETTEAPSEESPKWKILCEGNMDKLTEKQIEQIDQIYALNWAAQGLITKTHGQQIADLQNKDKDLEAKITHNAELIEQNKKDIAEQHGFVADSISQTAQLRSKYQDFTKEVKELKTKLADSKKLDEIEEKANSAKSKANNAYSLFSVIKYMVESIKDEAIPRLSNDVDNLQDKIAKQEKEVSNLQKSYNQLLNRLDAIEKKLNK